MKVIKMIDRCPYCGCSEFVQGKQEGYASVGPADKVVTFKSQALYHVICRNCGSVVRSYVVNPQKIVSKNNVIG